MDRDGDWFDGEVQITHPGILASLRRSLQRDGDGYFIQTRVRIPVQVDDRPFVVTRLEVRGQRLHAHLHDGSECEVDPSTLRLGPGEVPYCEVKDGRFEARVSRAAAYQLWRLAPEPGRDEEPTLRIGGHEVTIRRR